MTLIFYEKLELKTAHSPQEIRKRLEAGIGRPRGGGFAALARPEKLFEGSIDHNHFKFWRAIRHNNGFMPLVTGTIESGLVRAEFKLHPFVQVFMPLWLAGLLVIGWSAHKAGGTPAQCAAANYLPWGIVVFVVGLGLFFFNYYAGKARKFLEDIVK